MELKRRGFLALLSGLPFVPKAMAEPVNEWAYAKVWEHVHIQFAFPDDIHPEPYIPESDAEATYLKRLEDLAEAMRREYARRRIIV